MNSDRLSSLFFPLLLSVVALVLCPLFGASDVSIVRLFAGTLSAIETQIFFELRLPRVLAAFLIGGTLALSGTVLQALFQNSLATPFTLGVASAASFGAVLALKIGWHGSFWIFDAVSVFAFLGAATGIAIIYWIGVHALGLSSTATLLAGVAISFFFSSFILVLQYLSDFAELFRVMRWLMGSVEVSGWGEVSVLFVLALIGLSVVMYYARALDLLSLGQEYAVARGVYARQIQVRLFLVISLLVAASVSLCGPIGFVGIIIPHLTRQCIGAMHRVLAPASFLLGGVLLCVCDAFGRTLIAPSEIPVGVISALLGGPFFLMILLRKRL